MSGPAQHFQPWGPPPPGSGPGPHPQQWAPPPWAPPPWAPPPPWGPPPGPRRSRWATVGAPLLLVLVVLGSLGFFADRGFVQAIAPAQEAADTYATALVEQRWDDAHGMLCEGSADEYTAEDLATTFGQPPLVAYSIDGVNVVWSNGRTTGDAAITFVTRSGVRERTSVALVEEDGRWRVCF
ncbi:hypothetical protein [Blastococcus sp. TF02A-35]|uniref:Rv0361 family membrane protein n=1 Tax=Blastococcus sp. TF02A-35 TaxID=2559612 RepID=UPI00107392E6|nr:hypothetical protein [Blastococcus sp. TF02A_35]TFV52689.1 hypothetical protein E4P43_05160 [Blastococcus sp. TF02A_35]